jgi:hypothetical protein
MLHSLPGIGEGIASSTSGSTSTESKIEGNLASLDHKIKNVKQDLITLGNKKALLVEKFQPFVEWNAGLNQLTKYDDSIDLQTVIKTEIKTQGKVVDVFKEAAIEAAENNPGGSASLGELKEFIKNEKKQLGAEIDLVAEQEKEKYDEVKELGATLDLQIQSLEPQKKKREIRLEIERLSNMHKRIANLKQEVDCELQELAVARSPYSREDLLQEELQEQLEISQKQLEAPSPQKSADESGSFSGRVARAARRLFHI